MRKRANGREDEPLTLAAIDLGSNSFHMLIARYSGHDVRILDRLREPVRLAAGLSADKRLSEEAQDRAVACLERFGQRLAHVPPNHIRAVGTNTIRRARNAREFATRAQAALGAPIEVVSGQEEARLIYLGVTQTHAIDAERRLIVDIGGGSTEIIAGSGADVLEAHSLYMGCVDYSQRFFPKGEIDRERFRAAETAASLELQSIERPLQRHGWETVIGASGTVHAISTMLRLNGYSDRITLAGMKKLRKALVRSGSIESAPIRGLQASRAPVLPGGLSILIAIFKTLGLEWMRAAPGALREGLLYDLVGRIRHEDIRDRTIRRVTEQYHVDRDQALRVERAALQLYDQLENAIDGDRREVRRLLGWASRLHEIGLAVSHTGFHKHGAYLVQHSDMPGFSADEQTRVAVLIRTHRRKLANALFGDLPPDRVESMKRLCVLLRLAVLLNRSRTDAAIPATSVDDDWKRLRLIFASGWMIDHPLTVADLEQEAAYLSSVAIQLELREDRTGDEPRPAPEEQPGTARPRA